MSEDNIIELNDPFNYIVDSEDNFTGVQWMNKRGQIAQFDCDGEVFSSHTIPIPKHELRQLMIMWLALNYPDCLNYDDNEKEIKIRNSTKE